MLNCENGNSVSSHKKQISNKSLINAAQSRVAESEPAEEDSGPNVAVAQW